MLRQPGQQAFPHARGMQKHAPSHPGIHLEKARRFNLLDIADVLLPFMRSLVERIHMTVHLAVLDQGEAVYIEKVEAPGFFKVNTWVGRRMFLHSTSVGKCLLAWLPKHEVETIAKQQGLKKRTPKTITSMPKLIADLAHVKHSGYASADDDN